MTKENCIRLGDEIIIPLTDLNNKLLLLALDDARLVDISQRIGQCGFELLDIMREKSAEYINQETEDDLPLGLFSMG